MILAAEILSGWFLMAALAGYVWSIVRAKQKAVALHEYQMAMCRRGIRIIPGEVVQFRPRGR